MTLLNNNRLFGKDYVERRGQEYSKSTVHFALNVSKGRPGLEELTASKAFAMLLKSTHEKPLHTDPHYLKKKKKYHYLICIHS